MNSNPYRFSKSSLGHWLPLIITDRINVVEGIFDDFKHGHVPNIFAEKGMKADWKYNRKALVKKVIVTAAVTTAVVMLLRKKKAMR